jgi:hypothetical protein
MMQFMQYPEADRIETGIKVSWYIYKDRAIAEEAAKAAEHNAVIQSMRGFDFGYQSPGDIRKVEDGFKVTIP